MSKEAAIGLVGGVLAVMVVWLARRRKGGVRRDYDERQLLARGRAYRAGFFAFLLLCCGAFLAESVAGKSFGLLPPGELHLLIVLAALLVFVEVLIFSDAYFPLNLRLTSGWCAIMLLQVGLFILLGLLSRESWQRVMCLAVGVFGLAIMGGLFVKALLSRRDASGSDGD